MYFTREELKKLDTKDEKLKDKLNCIIEDEDCVMVFSRADFEIEEIKWALEVRVNDLKEDRKKEKREFVLQMIDEGISLSSKLLDEVKEVMSEVDK